tara:strand:- start:2885 stop:3325 length:441 start_codon:yes stop_codon:yes gene_type:complete
MSALSTTSNSVNQQNILQAKNAVNSMIELINDNKILEASNYLLDDTYFIRPTGNPLTKANWLQMLSSPDVKVVSNKLVQWNFADISPDNTWVYLCYTTHSVFNYMGNDNDDISVFTALVKNTKDGWKLSYAQRSSGRSPQDSLPKF